MKTLLIGSTLLTFGVGLPVFASGGERVNAPDGSGHIVLSLEEAKQKCAELQSNSQLRPFTIKVECHRERTFWQEEKNSLRLPYNFSFQGRALIKNMYEIQAESPFDQGAMAVKECPRFVEYRQAMEGWQLIDIKSCDQLNTIANLNSHCKEFLGVDERVDEAAAVPTGKIVDTCAAQIGAPEQGTPEQGTPEQGTPEQGTPEQGTPEQGTPEQGTPEQGTPEQGTPEQGTPEQGTPEQGLGQQQQGSDSSANWQVDHNILSNFGCSFRQRLLHTADGNIRGIEVSGSIKQNSMAGRLGLTHRDVIIAVNGAPVSNANQFAEAIENAQHGGRSVKVMLWRAASRRWTTIDARL